MEQNECTCNMGTDVCDVERIHVKEPTFEQSLEWLINKYSKENESNTPDYILAQYLSMCLAAFTLATNARTKFYAE